MLSGLIAPSGIMNVGKTLFAQVMEFLPWKTFERIVVRHNGDRSARTLNCAELLRILAFPQLTWRESLRDIEACLAANQAKLFHMGLGSTPARSTLSDALNQRDWRIDQALALRLIFKWIKQHLRIKRLLSTCENAVKTQIWSAFAAYVLFAIIRKELGLEASEFRLNVSHQH